MIICSAQGYSFSSKDNIPSETREYGNWLTNCVTNTTTYTHVRMCLRTYLPSTYHFRVGENSLQRIIISSPCFPWGTI